MLLRALALLLSCIAVAVPSRAQTVGTHNHSFGDADKWAKVFDDPKRDAWQKPHEVIQALGLAPDAVVADVGAGTGYFVVRLAHNVPRGRVYAVDVVPDMVKHVASRARDAGLTNVVAIAGTADDPRIPERADVILFVDVYHHIDDRERYFANLATSVKPAGRVAIVDFRVDSPQGPPRNTRIAPDRVKAELKAAGYTLAREHTFLPYQYFLEFVPAKR